MRDGMQWTRFLEPTCGQGNFIQGLLELDIPTPEIQGIDIQDKYIAYTKQLHQQTSAHLIIQQANIFDVNLQTDLRWKKLGPLLVLGNPPWVTNATLSRLESDNLPMKSNFKQLSGFSAITGESNFDIAEYIWLKIIRELAPERPTIAMLCKTYVARNILTFAANADLPIAKACIWKINSKKYFNHRHINEDTSHLEDDAPSLWKYLTKHRSICDARKSSIYRGKPPFVMFGIGDYSFSPYKVAISGLHKIPKFSAIGPLNGRPVQFDDTCYFIACTSAQQAALLVCLLNHPLCIQFLHSIVFWDAKRPITKKLLQRIDLLALLSRVNEQTLLEQAILTAKKLFDSEEIHLSWSEHLEDLLKNASSSLTSTD